MKHRNPSKIPNALLIFNRMEHTDHWELKAGDA
jgi:hypothetical protein